MAVVWKIETKQIEEGGEEACGLQVAFLETQCRTTENRIIQDQCGNLIKETPVKYLQNRRIG